MSWPVSSVVSLHLSKQGKIDQTSVIFSAWKCAIQTDWGMGSFIMKGNHCILQTIKDRRMRWVTRTASIINHVTHPPQLHNPLQMQFPWRSAQFTVKKYVAPSIIALRYSVILFQFYHLELNLDRCGSFLSPHPTHYIRLRPWLLPSNNANLPAMCWISLLV